MSATIDIASVKAFPAQAVSVLKHMTYSGLRNGKMFHATRIAAERQNGGECVNVSHAVARNKLARYWRSRSHGRATKTALFGAGWLGHVVEALGTCRYHCSGRIQLARSNDTYVLAESPRLRLEFEDLLGKIIGFQTIARPAEILFICNRSRRVGNAFASLHSQIDMKCNELDLSPRARCAAQRHASRLLRDGLGSLFESHVL